MGAWDGAIRRLARSAVATVWMCSAGLASAGSAGPGAGPVNADLTSAVRGSITTALAPAASPAAARTRPNIVLILTDDQRWDTLSWMPNVKRLLADKGVTFTNGFVTNALCCPSRTSILTGEYSHTTGVWGNDAPHGGFTAFHQDRSTIATWLRGAGYHTALIGKYLNGYQNAAHDGYVPPGWDRWVSFAMGNSTYYDYDLTVNGHIVHHGHAPADYATDVFTSKATSFIRETRGPLFLYYAPPAPHYPYTAAPRDADACPDLAPHRPPSFGEADVSDKPGYVRNIEWNSRSAGQAGWIRTAQCRSLLAVDRAVARIVASLQATHRLWNTMIVFTSDNGYLWGEHRLMHKAKPYEEAHRIPLVVRYDPVTSSPRVERRLALNIDLAPTFAALAGVGAPGVQGRSLLPLIRGRSVPWRTDFLLEHTLIEEEVLVPDYCGLRSINWSYVMYSTGAEELYDLRSDPYQLTNLARRSSAQAQRRRMRAEVLQRCRPLPPAFR